MVRHHLRSAAELQQEAAEQLACLRASCKAYDGGAIWEAKRIAAALYILLHDGRKPIRSILTQLGLRENFQYLSTAGLVTERVPVALVMVRIAEWGATFEPLCIDPARWGFFHDLPFHDWWKEPIFRSSDGRVMTRNDLVIAFRNKDGGGHYDHAIDDDVYVQFRTHDGMSTFRHQLPLIPAAAEHPVPEKIPNAHGAALRQIAWELDFSLGRAGLTPGSPQYREG
jgi:hypothetical protein